MDKATVKNRLWEATKEFLLMALYLWVTLGLFAVYRAVILDHDLSLLDKGFVVIEALVLAKVMLIARELHLGERVDEAPLIIPILVKSALFSAVLALFKILEEAARGLYHGRSFQQSIADIGGGTWLGVSCVAAILFILLIPFFAFTELRRGIGEGKMHELLFRSRQRLGGPSRNK